jgi:hypothetical protein
MDSRAGIWETDVKRISISRASKNCQKVTTASKSLRSIATMSPRHILVLGGSSPCGIAFCLAALRDSHTLTLYIRPTSISKLPAEISSSATIVTGDLTDATALERAISSGAKICVSFLGPIMSVKRGNMPVTDGFKIIVPLLQKYKYTRTLVLSTASYKAPEDKLSLLYWLLVMVVYLAVRSAYDEINGYAPIVTSTPVEELGWTVFRVPMLKNGEAVEVKAGFVGEKGVGMALERRALAEWVLVEMEEGKWVGKCPAVSNA